MDGDGEIELNEFIGWIILLLKVLQLHVMGPEDVRE